MSTFTWPLDAVSCKAGLRAFVSNAACSLGITLSEARGERGDPRRSCDKAHGGAQSCSISPSSLRHSVVSQASDLPMDPTTDSSSTDEEQDDDFQSYFGRVEDLEVYQRDREYFLSTMTELVTCSICRMVIGAPDVIERHERSHSEAIVELPDYDHIYRSMIEDREKEERDALLAEKKRKSESWKELFGEILPKDRSPGEHSDFEIVVEIDGKSHDLERFEVFLMDELRRLLGKKGATTSSATRANDSRLPVNLYKRWCPHPRCRKGFVKEELYRMHLRRFHNQLEEDTPANSGENLA